MEDTNLVEEDYGDAAAFSLAELGAKLFEKGFNVSPLDVRAGRMHEDRLERLLMLPLHVSMVSLIGTNHERSDFLLPNAVNRPTESRSD